MGVVPYAPDEKDLPLAGRPSGNSTSGRLRGPPDGLGLRCGSARQGKCSDPPHAERRTSPFPGRTEGHRKAEDGLELDGDNELAFDLLRKIRDLVGTDTDLTCPKAEAYPLGPDHPIRVAGSEAAFSVLQVDTYARTGFNTGVAWAIGHIASEHPHAFSKLTTGCDPDQGPGPRDHARSPSPR